MKSDSLDQVREEEPRDDKRRCREQATATQEAKTCVFVAANCRPLSVERDDQHLRLAGKSQKSGTLMMPFYCLQWWKSNCSLRAGSVPHLRVFSPLSGLQQKSNRKESV
jgi:hypothetical protein